MQGLSQAEASRRYDVSKGWVSKVMARYRTEGEAAFTPRSRRPRSSPRAVSEEVVVAVLAERDRLVASGHDAGPETIAWHLEQAGHDAPSRASIARILTRNGRVVPAPKKKPKAAHHRFEADQPNECWQSDVTHIRLADGTDVEVITWLDDHSRMALHISAHARVTGHIVLETFRAAVAEYGCPASTLTDNGMVYTVRHSAFGVRGGRNAFETELATRGITQKNGRGNHPQTQGKVERFQQTLKTWLARQGPTPETIEDLQTLLDRFRGEYNHHRPHRSLNRRTPAAAYTTRPKATPPSEPPDRTHTRIRHDRVNNGKITLRHAGTLYSIGLGRHHNGTPVTALVHGLDITILDATTGEVLRKLTLDTTHKYQPQTPRNPQT
ncbi:IS481 family transposase [Phycicoccus sp. CSK15P-2]|uniref:IS481 family transposase n=1 Tax=Phycicoccus sp. CSK15P-2 TaxID=2807627 RepID=UPI0027DE35C8|nr:IS481 family transposase [Phycicoccus sp. CSK15P-2]